MRCEDRGQPLRLRLERIVGIDQQLPEQATEDLGEVRNRVDARDDEDAARRDEPRDRAKQLDRMWHTGERQHPFAEHEIEALVGDVLLNERADDVDSLTKLRIVREQRLDVRDARRIALEQDVPRRLERRGVERIEARPGPDLEHRAPSEKRRQHTELSIERGPSGEMRVEVRDVLHDQLTSGSGSMKRPPLRRKASCFATIGSWYRHASSTTSSGFLS